MAHIQVIGRIGRMWKLWLLMAAVVVGVSGLAVAGQGQRTSGVAYVGVTHTEGSDVYVSGDFKDRLLGRGAIVYVTRLASGDQPATVRINVRRATIYTKRGSLSGTGQALQTFNPDGTGTISDGSFRLTKGTGAYRGHSLIGTLRGTYEEGVYTFHYRARYR